MVDDSDWRLQGQERYLHGVTLVRRRYRAYAENPSWDHDHCEFCQAKFMVEDHPDVLHEGYATIDDYWWICVTCFEDSLAPGRVETTIPDRLAHGHAESCRAACVSARFGTS